MLRLVLRWMVPASAVDSYAGSETVALQIQETALIRQNLYDLEAQHVKIRQEYVPSPFPLALGPYLGARRVCRTDERRAEGGPRKPSTGNLGKRRT
jgi:hypothetical protein